MWTPTASSWLPRFVRPEQLHDVVLDVHDDRCEHALLVGTTDLAASTSQTSNDNAPKAVSVIGVGQPSSLHVVYNQSSQSNGSQSNGLIDLVIGLNDGKTTKNVKKSDSISALALSLLGGDSQI